MNAGAPPPDGPLARGATARLALPDLAGHAYLTRGVVAQVALTAAQGAAADGPGGWLWVEGVPDPAVAVLGATLAASTDHGVGPVAATASSWTPVQIGG